MTNRHHASMPDAFLGAALGVLARLPRRAAHLLIRAYQLTFSSLVGRQCRHLPTCSHYADEAIRRHGFWAGAWLGTARICRCQPFGTSGFDPVPARLDPRARWYLPWRYGRWRGVAPATSQDAKNSEPGNVELR